MPITTISQEQFANFDRAAGAMSLPIYEEIEWYKDTAGNLLGALVVDKVDKDFCYVVMGRDQNNEFRAIDFEVGAESISEAREKLITSMKQYEASGKPVFPQDE